MIIASSNAERVAGAVARLQAHKLPGEVRGEVVDAKDAAALKAFAAHVGAVDHIAWTSGDVPASVELAMASAYCSQITHPARVAPLTGEILTGLFTVRFWGPMILAQSATINAGGSFTLTGGKWV